LSLFFGFLSVVNAFEIGFFLYYPRTIYLNIFSPTVDLYVWLGSIFAFVTISFILRHFGVGIRAVYFGIDVSTILLGFLLLFAPSVNHPYIGVETGTIGVLLIFLGVSMHLILHITGSGRALPISGKATMATILIYISSLIIPIELSALKFWVLSAFNPANTVGREKALLELQFSYLAYPLLQALYLAFLFSWIWIPVLLFFKRRFGKTRFYASKESSQSRPAVRSFSIDQTGPPSGKMTVRWRRIGPKIILVSSLLVAMFTAYYPYFHGPSWLVGTDTYWRYLDPLQKVVNEGSWTAALQERHPAYLLILLGLKTITSASSFLAVKFMPMVSILLLALATFWLVKVSVSNEYLASLASVFSVLSITTTEGIYTGILANWFALILWVLFFVFFLKALKKRIFQEKSRNVQLQYFTILTVLSLGILFVHPWTWGVFLAVFICYVGLTVVRDRSVARKMGVMAALILLANAVSVILSFFLLPNAQGWRLVNMFSLYEWPFQHLGILLGFWDVLGFLVRVYSGFLSPLIFILALVGLVVMMSRRGEIENLVISWTAIASIGSVLAAPLGYTPSLPTHTELIRVLFITPLQIPAAVGLYSIMNAAKQSLSHNDDQKSMRPIALSSNWLPPMLLIFNYAIISELFSIDYLVVELISLLVLNFAVVTVLLFHFEDHLNVCATSLIALIVVLSLVNCCFSGLFPLLKDPNYYRP